MFFVCLWSPGGVFMSTCCCFLLLCGHYVFCGHFVSLLSEQVASKLVDVSMFVQSPPDKCYSKNTEFDI